MKLLSLHIHNLASITDATIPFNEAPLSSADLFLICGPIGAGKSTVLDAICLALFRTTPRLEASKQGRSRGVKIASNSDELLSHDPRNLMRRETGEAWVRLLLEGLDGCTYAIEWHVQRGKNKRPTAALSADTWSIENCSTGHLVSGEKEVQYKEVAAAIQAVIGLDFSEFCRTTLLAQGEFTRFLSSDEDAKASILEKITDTSIYSEIGKTIYFLDAQKKRLWEQERDRIGDIVLLTDEQVKACREAIQAEEDTLQRLQALQEDYRKRLAWLRLSAEDHAAVAAARKRAEEAAKAVEAPTFQAAEKRVAQWFQTLDLRRMMAERNQAHEEKEQARTRFSTLHPVYLRTLRGAVAQEAYMQSLWTDYRRQRQALALAVRAWAQRQPRWAEECRTLREQIRVAELELSTLDKMCTEWANTVNKFAKQMRSLMRTHLTAGERCTCPVCGQGVATLSEEMSLSEEYLSLCRQRDEKAALLDAPETGLRARLLALEEEEKRSEQTVEQLGRALEQPRQLFAEQNRLRRAVRAVRREVEEVCPKWRTEQVEAETDRQLLSTWMQVKEVVTLRGLYENALKRYDALHLAFTTHLEQQTFTEDELLALQAVSLQQVNQEKQQQDNLRNAVESSRAALREAEERMRRHEADEQVHPASANEQDTAEGLQAEMTRLEQEKQEPSKQKYSLENQLLTDERNRREKGDTTRRDALLKDYERWHRFAQYFIDQHADGSKMRTIAQGFVLNSLLERANARLQEMQPRYRLLRVEGTLHLKLEDAYQGYTTRPTHTISGGESFLVSLALALALADFGGRIGMDTLFIDEGFGTLSGPALQSAILTLKSVHNHSGRHVGIISHREEVKDSIPVQIRVDRPETSSACTITITDHD